VCGLPAGSATDDCLSKSNLDSASRSPKTGGPNQQLDYPSLSALTRHHRYTARLVIEQKLLETKRPVQYEQSHESHELHECSVHSGLLIKTCTCVLIHKASGRQGAYTAIGRVRDMLSVTMDSRFSVQSIAITPEQSFSMYCLRLTSYYSHLRKGGVLFLELHTPKNTSWVAPDTLESHLSRSQIPRALLSLSPNVRFSLALLWDPSVQLEYESSPRHLRHFNSFSSAHTFLPPPLYLLFANRDSQHCTTTTILLTGETSSERETAPPSWSLTMEPRT
jgi:hypothetical protein